jgi:hypothetical protein
VIRFHILFRKTGAIFDPKGMAERVIAATGSSPGQMTLYVATKNRDRFEKLLNAEPEVMEYTVHPVDMASRMAEAAGRKK